MVFKSSRQISQKLSLHYDAVWFKLQESSSQVIQFSTEFLFVIEVFRKLLKGLLIRGALCPFLFLIGEWINSHAVGFPSTRILIYWQLPFLFIVTTAMLSSSSELSSSLSEIFSQIFSSWICLSLHWLSEPRCSNNHTIYLHCWAGKMYYHYIVIITTVWEKTALLANMKSKYPK